MLLRRHDVKQTGNSEEIDEEEDMSSIGQDELLAYTKLQLEAAQVWKLMEKQTIYLLELI